MLLLPECDATNFSECSNVWFASRSKLQGKIPVEFTAGWKEHASGESSTDLLEAADRAVYQTKRCAQPRTNLYSPDSRNLGPARDLPGRLACLT
jgi:hypothetical protein